MNDPVPAGSLSLPEESLNLLEFFKLTAQLAGRTQTAYGHAAALALRPLSGRAEMTTALAEAGEMLRLHATRGLLAVGHGRDLSACLDGLRIAGTRLEPETLREVQAAIEAAGACRRLLGDAETCPLLQALGAGLTPLPELAAQIRRSIGPRDEILDTASFALGDLRQQLQHERGRIKRQLEKLLGDEALLGVFQEQLITDRNGRYVLPVRTDHSGRLRGFVHDVSASGQTLFIEPAAVLDGNNRLQTLQREIRTEEERILLQLTAAVREVRRPLADNQALLARLDLRQAVARLTRELDASIPELTDEPQLELLAARHPLLVLARAADGAGAVTPVDLRLAADQQALIISGPNTGGKSVALKTIGLLVLMARAGLPIPAVAGSRLFPFAQVLVDIGDEQSLELSLSTFSGHLLRMREIVAGADARSLVLLDELGTGTDPSEGAALALALLDELRRRGARMVATTHLHVIKGYAHLEEGVGNAAVEFDIDTLQPTYRLHYGIPGASHAFTIARRLGLPGELLDRAEEYLGVGEREGLAVVERLQALRSALEEELHAAGSMRQEAAKELDQRRRLRRELEERQSAILAETRQQGSRLLAEAEARIRELFRQAGQGERQPREQARITGAVRALREELPQVAAELPGVAAETVEVGELLHVVALGVDAQVVAVEGASVRLDAGGKQLRQPLAALRQYQPRRFANRQAPPPRIRDRVTRSEFRPRLVLVGKRADEAQGLLERFLDDAQLHAQRQLEVVHGSGQGILRRLVRELLAGRPEVVAFHAADLAAGGDNVTVVELR